MVRMRLIPASSVGAAYNRPVFPSVTEKWAVIDRPYSQTRKKEAPLDAG